MTPAEMASAACALLNARCATGRLTVSIDGCGGAGKSTLAKGISDTFAGRVSIVRCDDFYRPLLGAQYALTAQQAYDNYLDWRRLRDEALMPLRNGNSARYQRYDWSTDSLAEWIEIEPGEIVIVEGVFSMRPELQPLIDLTIFIETAREERIRRMRSRPQPSTSWMEQWLAAEDWYLDKVTPQNRADLVIVGM